MAFPGTRKSADEARSSQNLANDSDLAFSLVAGRRYLIDGCFNISSLSERNGGMKINFQVPADARLKPRGNWECTEKDVGNRPVLAKSDIAFNTPGANGDYQLFWSETGGPFSLRVRLQFMVRSPGGGNLRVQWGKGDLDLGGGVDPAATVVMEEDSHLLITDLT